MTPEELWCSWDAITQLQTRASGNHLSEGNNVAANVGLNRLCILCYMTYDTHFTTLYNTMPVYNNRATYLCSGTGTSAREQKQAGQGANL